MAAAHTSEAATTDRVDQSPSNISIYAALAGNVGVCAAKLVGFALSGSSSMLVEAIHSSIDTLNQVLLLIGVKRSRQPADTKHPFGYGLEAYFWTLIVGILIFLLGGVAAIFEGVDKLLHPTPIAHAGLSLGILGICLVFDVIALRVALKQSDRTRSKLSRQRYPTVSLYQFIHFSPDPGVFEVLAEDAASVVGLVIAAFGVIGAAWFGWHWADGAAAIAIGALLVVVAIAVLLETKSLLTGEGATDTVVDALRDVIAKDPDVASIRDLLTMNLGPHEILVAVTLDLTDDRAANEIEHIGARLTHALGQKEPRVRRLFLRIDGA